MVEGRYFHRRTTAARHEMGDELVDDDLRFAWCFVVKCASPVSRAGEMITTGSSVQMSSLVLNAFRVMKPMSLEGCIWELLYRKLHVGYSAHVADQ